MGPTILVTGAPGNVGSEVVKGLTGRAQIRVAAYDVEAATQAFGTAAECVPFDFLDPATFAAAFRGIETLFLVRPPALSNVNRDIAPALYTAKKAGVRHVVFLSLQGVGRNPFVPHHYIERLIEKLGFRYTFLRCGFFMQNLSTTHRDEIRDHNTIALPVGDGRTSFVDVRDIAAVAVRVLTHLADGNRIYTLTGGVALDHYMVAQTMSHVLGRVIRYTNPSVLRFVRQEVVAGRGLGFTLVMAALYTATRFGSAKEVTADVSRLLGRQPITFAQFVSDYRECWVPEAPPPHQ